MGKNKFLISNELLQYLHNKSIYKICTNQNTVGKALGIYLVMFRVLNYENNRVLYNYVYYSYIFINCLLVYLILINDN